MVVKKKSVGKVSGFPKSKVVVSKKKKVRSVRKVLSSLKYMERRISNVWRSLILYSVLFILSFVLYNVSSEEFYVNLFFLFSVILGFVMIAFVLVLLIYFFLKVMHKK